MLAVIARRPIALPLTDSQVADCIAADAIQEQRPTATILHDDEGCDGDTVHGKTERKGIAPNIPK